MGIIKDSGHSQLTPVTFHAAQGRPRSTLSHAGATDARRWINLPGQLRSTVEWCLGFILVDNAIDDPAPNACRWAVYPPTDLKPITSTALLI
jgi:hypothetical protein